MQNSMSNKDIPSAEHCAKCVEQLQGRREKDLQRKATRSFTENSLLCSSWIKVPNRERHLAIILYILQ
jgi:hypothetical protein